MIDEDDELAGRAKDALAESWRLTTKAFADLSPMSIIISSIYI